ncbi:drug/metabolite transporter (DMT)-like permease [Kineococcus radiotolerans]|uniref:Drug/metabolite transporter (DMT)-like permease n=1 Tax=Kineococcus radiotolerans TaxID=131568 RepID=A0A7W4TKP2_KINRA|nr:hypothetical protein [Kineococcus radiotolerans]MBB2900689.1 drug/metabolite transporter (DMT)-like permease [Kineococcus radiotolerans]
MTPAPAAAVLAACGYAAGSVLQASGVRRTGGGGPRGLVRSPLYLGGLGADGVAWLLSLLALRRLPAFAVQSLLAGSLALTVLLARAVLGSRLRARDTAAVAVLVAALAVVGGAGTEQPSPAVGGAVGLGLCTGAGAVLLALVLLRRSGSSTQAVLAGLGFSVAALGARVVTVPDERWRVVLEPVAWAVVAAGVAGTLGYAAALERGPVGTATALLWSVEVVVPAVAGVALLGDAVRPGWTTAAAVALVVVVACSVVLAGSPAAPGEP